MSKQKSKTEVLNRKDVPALLAEIERLKATWRCFHCGFETSDNAIAQAHFGDKDDEGGPLCRDWSLLTEDERILLVADLHVQVASAQEAEGMTCDKLRSAEAEVERLKSEYAELKVAADKMAALLFDTAAKRVVAISNMFAQAG